ncbi:MarR family winged helix-turn-helix transcriptional regulator [Nocardia sp. NPDC056000]|uniref:MarR family winged helix-turn-helix transcriptional regulator n=1 Tax=Nocardia sp. NPDC056000 TaxID=3345674 RepID=UPI0035D8F5C6
MGEPYEGHTLSYDHSMTPVPTPACPYVVAWHFLRHVGEQLDQVAAADLKSSHLLHASDYLILLALRTAGTMRMGELAEATLLLPSRLTGRVTELEAQGHVTRESAGADARGVQVAISPLGLSFLATAEATHSKHVMELLAARLTKPEVTQLIELITKIPASPGLPMYLRMLGQDYHQPAGEIP